MSTGNAFTNPSAAKIDQQRKILEELERQKKALKSSSSSSSAASSAGSSSSSSSLGCSTVGTSSSSSSLATDPHQMQMTSNQRAALDLASKTSYGFFIPQDSLFGNLILPVIPRIPPN